MKPSCAMTARRAEELRRLVRAQIVNAINNDLDNGEFLMKEAFEEAAGDAVELHVIYTEMKAIKRLIEERVVMEDIRASDREVSG